MPLFTKSCQQISLIISGQGNEASWLKWHVLTHELLSCRQNCKFETDLPSSAKRCPRQTTYEEKTLKCGFSHLVNVVLTYRMYKKNCLNCKIGNKLNFKICKSVHRHTIPINQQTGCKNFPSLLLDVYVQLNVFRASSLPSSGAQQL